jgi:hypothetical protein
LLVAVHGRNVPCAIRDETQRAHELIGGCPQGVAFVS